MLAAAALALFGCSEDEPEVAPPSTPATTSAASPTTEADASTAFTDEEARFSAEFPAEPSRNVEQVSTATGAQDVVVFYYEDDDQSLGVTFTDFTGQPLPSAEQFNRSVLNSIAAENGGTVKSSQVVDFLGTTAVDGVIEYEGAVQFLRAVLVSPGYGYTLSQLGPTGSEPTGDYGRLLATFARL